MLGRTACALSSHDDAVRNDCGALCPLSKAYGILSKAGLRSSLANLTPSDFAAQLEEARKIA